MTLKFIALAFAILGLIAIFVKRHYRKKYMNTGVNPDPQKENIVSYCIVIFEVLAMFFILLSRE